MNRNGNLKFFFLWISGLFPVFSSISQCYLPRANMKALTPQMLSPCLGDSVRLEAAYRPDSVQYQWYKDGVPIVGAQASVYKAISNGNYHFVYRRGNCESQFYDLIPISYRPFPKVAKPQLSLQIPPDSQSCYQSFTLTASNVSAADTLVWLNAGVPVPGAAGISLQGTVLGLYQLLVKSATGCQAISESLSVQVSGTDADFKPRIDTASVVRVNGSQRCVMSWQLKNPANARLLKIRALREKTGIPGFFEPLNSTAVGTDSAYLYLDTTSQPWKRPYFYGIQSLVQCGSDSFYTEPSPLHKCIHLNLTRSGNHINLLWSPYSGFAVESYRILGYNATGGLVISIPVDSTVYTFTNPNPNITSFQIEALAKATDVYLPFGRISARPRKSKSNTRPTIQSIPGGDSTSIFNADVVITSVRAVKKSAAEFNIFPSPSANGGGDIFASSGIQKAEVFDLQGRTQAIQVEEKSSNHWKLWLPASAENGLYFVRVYSGGGNLVKPWLLQR